MLTNSFNSYNRVRAVSAQRMTIGSKKFVRRYAQQSTEGLKFHTEKQIAHFKILSFLRTHLYNCRFKGN